MNILTRMRHAFSGLRTAPCSAHYYLCSDSMYQRLHQETRCLFERFPEDDGVMIFDRGERIRRLESAIRTADNAVRDSTGAGLLHVMPQRSAFSTEGMDTLTVESVLSNGKDIQ